MISSCLKNFHFLSKEDIMKKQQGFIAWLMSIILVVVALLIGVAMAIKSGNYESAIIGVGLIVTIAVSVWKYIARKDEEEQKAP